MSLSAKLQPNIELSMPKPTEIDGLKCVYSVLDFGQRKQGGIVIQSERITPAVSKNIVGLRSPVLWIMHPLFHLVAHFTFVFVCVLNWNVSSFAMLFGV